ncbi:MAG: NfeD family protein, partial [Solirubrobacterales bacterium]|nr:NfeD family protein [Solirubrobacterales bacterium]
SLRPLVAERLLAHAPALKTGGERMVGKHAVVLERISNAEAVGRVRIEGEVWTARAYDQSDTIEPGALVEVVEINGATALVMR